MLFQHSYGTWKDTVHCMQRPELLPVFDARREMVAGAVFTHT
jgi:hypothetical protein